MYYFCPTLKITYDYRGIRPIPSLYRYAFIRLYFVPDLRRWGSRHLVAGVPTADAGLDLLANPSLATNLYVMSPVPGIWRANALPLTLDSSRVFSIL